MNGLKIISKGAYKMASIVERGNSISVVYYINGKPKWEAAESKKAANDRKIEIEYQQSKGTFVPPSTKTVEDLMEQYINTYGKANWGFSAFTSNCGLIDNYVLPLIGKTQLKKCTTKSMTLFFSNLSGQKAVQLPGRKEPSLISDRNIYEIFGLLNVAFRLAVEWEEISKHPLTKSMKPKSKRGKRKTWDAETAKKAVSVCESLRLLIYLHLALACSMRIGEISGLQKSMLFLDEENNYENAYLNIDRQLVRISKKAFQELTRKKNQIKLIFPEQFQNKEYKTMLVLKTPKTDSSIRTVYIPKTTAKLLHKWLLLQKERKNELGSEYHDFDLVMDLNQGRPIESKIIGEELDKLIEDHNLPDVDFHSTRHTSTAVKLVFTQGDIKSVQGDTGHAQAKMVTDTYAEIDDLRRKKHSKQFDELFFEGKISEDFSDELLEKIINSLLENDIMKEKFLRILNKNSISRVL